MADNITSTTQLSTFSTIRTILLTSSVLSAKFNTNNIYNFTPKTKGLGTGFKGFPYIIIRIPNTGESEETMDNVAIKPFTVDIELVMDYTAKDNYTTYANAIIDIIEQSESTLENLGYFNSDILLNDTDDEASINQKEVIVGSFTLTMMGNISR